MAKEIDLQWDLSSGKAVAGNLVLEIPVVAGPTWGVQIDESAFPYTYADGETAEFVLDVWNLDRRMALIWSHYLKPSDWWAQFGGLVGPSRPAPSQEVSVEAILILKAGQTIQEMGPYPEGLWLNGRSGTKDGIEIVTGAQGVRFKFSVTFHGLSAWDVVGQMVLKPDQVFGCDSLGQKVAQKYSAVIPPQAAPVQFHT